VIERPELSQINTFDTPENRKKNDSVLIKTLSEIFLQRTAKEWISDMNAVGIPCALAVENYETGFFSDLQAVENGMISEQDTDSMGQVKFSANLIDFANSERPAPTVTPLLGEHNREILEHLGYSSLEVEEFYKNQIINTDAGSKTD
jgi:crotonobetainyl-CoA:carnitine CoA-transferase CaiB-like acyl-CoA transferase